jgi:serine/threonine protein kinase
MDIPKKIGRYEILDELGHGAMGTVYRAKDPAMDRVVALKTINSVIIDGEQQSEFRERFYREARAAGALAHPGIVPVFDVGEHEGTPFLVMEFINGRTLADAVANGERLSLDGICEIGQRVAEALGYAHQRGVVHRDIKPANILLTSREAHGIERPKITDFGVAKLAEGHTTQTGQMVGTPAFMPPEQFTGTPIDGRADIFSLGVVLYWMVTGEKPFPGESLTAVAYKVVHTDPVPPRKLNPSLPLKIENIILKCLAKSPAERYQTGEALALDLGELRNKVDGPKLESDSDTTMIGSSSRLAARPATESPQLQITVEDRTKRNNRFVVAAAIAAVVIGGVWYASHSQRKLESQVQAPPPELSATPAPAATGAGVSMDRTGTAAQSPVAPAKVPAPALSAAAIKPTDLDAKKPGATLEATEGVSPSATASDVPPGAPALDFDPRTLDPKQNARLKIDSEQMPQGLDFTVEMNGKPYFRKTGAGGKPQDDGFYVPPGIHEFRVTAESGALEKASNTVSTEFKAKKRNTLTIELRIAGQAKGAGVPQGLYPDSQLVLSLK